MRKFSLRIAFLVFGFMLFAILVQGVGLQLPGVLKVLTASVAAPSSPSSVGKPVASEFSSSSIIGLGVRKDCPIPPVAPGSVYTCTFEVQNLDASNKTGLSFASTVPCPDLPCTGGTTTAVPCLQSGVAVTTLGPFGTATDTCTGSLDETAPACTASDMSFIDKIEAQGFDGVIAVEGSTNNFVTILACTGNQGCTSGFWKNHTGAGSQTDAWCTTYTPSTLVSSVFDTTDCGCNFSSLTFLQALNLSSGNTLCEAQGKLYQPGVTALLNACSGSGVAYQLNTVQIKSEVNTALQSCSRATILNEASRLDGFNNGLGGCPLDEPASIGISLRN